MSSPQRRSREEILEAFKACASVLGRTPGKDEFEKRTGIKESEVQYYWAKPSALAEDAGLQPNTWRDIRLPDSEVFEDYARICLLLKKIPSVAELRIAQRQHQTKTYTVYTRFSGGIEEFQTHFRSWLQTSSPDLQAILQFNGWRASSSNNNDHATTEKNIVPPHPGLRPFLPASLQYLNVIARGERPPYEAQDISVETLFERRTADAFRCLGFEIKQLGQGTGRNADSLAVAPHEHFGLIIDAKVRSAGYVLGTEDRKFLEYAKNHGKELQRQGLKNIYFVVIASSFKSSDWQKLSEYLSESPIRSVILITASALMRIVEESIRNRSMFSLHDLEKEFFAKKEILD